jgi:hypothetical protein
VKEIVYVIIFGISNLCALAQIFSLSGMVVFHLYLVSHNMTHIEYNCCKGMVRGFPWRRLAFPLRSRGASFAHPVLALTLVLKAPNCRFDRGVFFNLRELFGQYFFLICIPYYVPPGTHTILPLFLWS